MQKNMHFLSKLILVTLVMYLAGPAYGIMTRVRSSQGNNVQLEIHSDESSVFCGTSMFPKGSGNLIPSFEGGWGNCIAVARDINGDGAMEDSCHGSGRARSIPGSNCSLESYAELEALFNSGERMDQAANRIEHNRVWSTLDTDDLADWPPEFRAGRTASGAINKIGAETISTRLGDCFSSSFTGGVPPRGVSFEYSFYFLNFGESNNMVYGHLFIRNMSEYLKWSPNEAFRTQVANTPNGQKWNFCLNYFTGYFGIGSNAVSMDEGWAMHPAKEIVAVTDRDGMEDGFTQGGIAFSVGHKMLRAPQFKGQQAIFTGMHGMRWGSDFGGPQTRDLFQTSDAGLVYRACLGELYPNLDELANQMYGGQLNPLTGRPCWGWPGQLRPTDQYYNLWVWGNQGRTQNAIYAEITDFGPRDSTSCDYVLMFVYPANAPYVYKTLDIANIYDPDLQVHMVPMQNHAEVAQVVYDGAYILPETPVAPPLTIVPGDRKVTITWSNVNLNTPDAYYFFIQQHPEIDPDGLYREYDFEGYRLYRSFVGPSDSHSELIFDCSLSDNNIQFYYIDSSDLDQPYYRLRDGLKVWYALVPFDKNYDPASGVEFSLPELISGKTWNRPREGLYTVTPRSEASNFKPASLGAVAYLGQATLEGPTVELAGDGAGKLTEAPKSLIPPLDFSFEAVNSERIKQDLTVFVACTGLEVDWGCSYWAFPMREISLLDGSNNSISAAPPFLTRDPSAEIVLMDKADASGVNYAVHVLWNHPGSAGNRDYAPVYIDFNTGGYTGATVANQFGSCVDTRIGTGPSIGSYIRTGVFEVAWKSAGGGLSVDVTDKTRGETVPFSPYREDKAWGFMPGGTYMDFFDEVKAGVSKAERANLMSETIPADNTDEFAISINGIVWAFTDLAAMPASGTVMTITNAFGEWNGDQTVFTQYADAPYPGDKWQIQIKGMTMDPEDADLTKIRVVPNPYMATSVLDLSPLSRRIEFVNLPDRCTIRIFTLGGNLVNVLNHVGSNKFGWGNYTDVDRIKPDNTAEVFTGYDNHGGAEPWNLRNRFGQTVASGLYFFHVTDSRGETQTGRFYIIN